jgi:DNA-binding transcriptional LysR family regulator
MNTPKLSTAHPLEWNDLSVILAICRSQSLSGAARALGCTHSTIFRQINAIEDKTGVRFFDRFRHGYVMTDAGRTAMRYAERIEGEVHALGLEVLGRDTELRGRVRVTSPEAFAEDHAPGIMARFCRQHPDIQVDLSPGHGALDLNRREAEVAIRATSAAPENAFGRKIGDFGFAMYGAPDYLNRTAGSPLADHRFCLIEGTVSWLVGPVFKTADQGEVATVFQCRASRAVRNACAEGMGLTLLPCYFGDADDRIERASDTLAPLDLELWVITHPDLKNTARVRALMAHLYDELGQMADLFAGRLKSPGKVNLIPRRA